MKREKNIQLTLLLTGMHFESNILLAIFAQIFLQTHDGEVWFLYLFVGEQVSGVVSTLSQLVGESESETKPIKCGTKPLQSNKHRAGPVKPPQTPQWTDRAKCQLRRDLICEGKHRKNCECCPGHYLIVNHYTSMSWFKFRNSSEMVNCVTNSLNRSQSKSKSLSLSLSL